MASRLITIVFICLPITITPAIQLSRNSAFTPLKEIPVLNESQPTVRNARSVDDDRVSDESPISSTEFLNASPVPIQPASFENRDLYTGRDSADTPPTDPVFKVMPIPRRLPLLSPIRAIDCRDSLSMRRSNSCPPYTRHRSSAKRGRYNARLERAIHADYEEIIERLMDLKAITPRRERSRSGDEGMQSDDCIEEEIENMEEFRQMVRLFEGGSPQSDEEMSKARNFNDVPYGSKRY